MVGDRSSPPRPLTASPFWASNQNGYGDQMGEELATFLRFELAEM